MRPLDLLSHSELKAWLESLQNLAELEQCALTQRLYEMDIVQRFLGRHPEQSSASTGHAVCMALRDFWRGAFMQRNFSPKLKRVWNTFFILEAAYFYPAVVTSVFPGSLYELGALLCNREYLALLVADGHMDLAQKIASGNPTFWEAIIPHDEMPSPQTLSSRRDAAIEKLVKELNRQLELTILMTRPPVTAPVIPGREISIQHTGPSKLAQDKGGEAATLVHRPAYPPASEHHRDALWAQYQEQFLSRLAYNEIGLRLHTWWPQGDEISPSDLDAVAASIDIASLMSALGVRLAPDRIERWNEDRGILLALLERFAAHGDDDLRLQCAACLRHSQLSKTVAVEVNIRSKFGKIKRLSALESIARIALDRREDEFARSLAEAILSQQRYVEQLWNLDKFYAPLAQKLTIVLGDCLYYDENSGRLELTG